jgi:large subunit ribosomal protein L15
VADDARGGGALKLNNLAPAPGSTRSRKRVGRGPGSGHGKTAGRGNKGFWSRSGSSMKRGFEGGQMPLHRRIPKRGFTNIFRTEYAVVNVDQIESRFEAGAVVDPDALRARRLVSRSRMPVKLLARGGVTKALTVRVHRASAEARKKIEAAGGKVELL